MTDYDALCRRLEQIPKPRTGEVWVGHAICDARDAIAALVARVKELEAEERHHANDMASINRDWNVMLLRAEAAEARVAALETKVGLQLHIMAKLRAEMNIRATLQGVDATAPAVGSSE